MKNTTVQQWTKEIPTEDGWYWIRRGDVTRIDYVDNGGVWSYHPMCEEDIHDLFHSEQGYEFYGPLKEPK